MGERQNAELSACSSNAYISSVFYFRSKGSTSSFGDSAS